MNAWYWGIGTIRTVRFFGTIIASSAVPQNNSSTCSLANRVTRDNAPSQSMGPDRSCARAQYRNARRYSPEQSSDRLGVSRESSFQVEHTVRHKIHSRRNLRARFRSQNHYNAAVRRSLIRRNARRAYPLRQTGLIHRSFRSENEWIPQAPQFLRNKGRLRCLIDSEKNPGYIRHQIYLVAD